MFGTYKVPWRYYSVVQKPIALQNSVVQELVAKGTNNRSETKIQQVLRTKGFEQRESASPIEERPVFNTSMSNGVSNTTNINAAAVIIQNAKDSLPSVHNNHDKTTLLVTQVSNQTSSKTDAIITSPGHQTSLTGDLGNAASTTKGECGLPYKCDASRYLYCYTCNCKETKLILVFILESTKYYQLHAAYIVA